MPIFTLGCWCQLRFGQEWTHCFKDVAHFAKRAGTIRVQGDSRYIPNGSLHSDYASYTSSCIAATLGTSKLARVNHPPTSSLCTGCPLWLCCQWTSTELYLVPLR
jgi:hypothetical protein